MGLASKYCRHSNLNMKGALLMKKVKITVLKTTLDQELALEYGAQGLAACPMHEAGQIFLCGLRKARAFL